MQGWLCANLWAPLWSHHCQEEAPKMPLPDAIFCQVGVVC
jgi:hypothetical protein